jgi:hypothetical protein
MDTLNLTHTKAALAEYDACKAKWAALQASDAPFGVLWAHMNEEDRLARAVGHAFWLDTSDRNSRATCEGCVRPNPWLRNLVAKYGNEVQVEASPA